MKTTEDIKVHMGGLFKVLVKAGAPVRPIVCGGGKIQYAVTDRDFVEGTNDHDWTYRYCYVPTSVVDQS